MSKTNSVLKEDLLEDAPETSDGETKIDGRRLAAIRALLLLSPLWLALGVEGALRLYYFISYSVPGKSYGIYQYDKELGAVHAAKAYNNNAETNDYGFRNTEDVFEPKPPGSLRIITYGGSNTFCYNLTNNDAWPLQLQSLLRARRPGGEKDQVLNGGVIMWSIGQLFAKAKRDIPKLKPDYVFIYTGVNERSNADYLADEGRPLQSLLAKGEIGPFSLGVDQNYWMIRHSLFYKAVRTFIFHPVTGYLSGMFGAKNEWPSEPDPILMENYSKTAKAFIEFLRENGVKPIFVKEVYGFNPEKNKNTYLMAYSNEVSKVAASWGATVIDPTPVVANYPGNANELFIESGVHWTKSGAVRFAEYLLDHSIMSKAAVAAPPGEN